MQKQTYARSYSLYKQTEIYRKTDRQHQKKSNETSFSRRQSKLWKCIGAARLFCRTVLFLDSNFASFCWVKPVLEHRSVHNTEYTLYRMQLCSSVSFMITCTYGWLYRSTVALWNSFSQTMHESIKFKEFLTAKPPKIQDKHYKTMKNGFCWFSLLCSNSNKVVWGI